MILTNQATDFCDDPNPIRAGNNETVVLHRSPFIYYTIIMKTGEFEIIRRYFTPHLKDHPEIIQGVGDDAAVWQCEGATLVASVDTLLEGRHFFSNCAPEDVAYKALMVNLSDFAAMGATPRWFTLALTIPSANESWLQAFSISLSQLSQQYQLALIGGDTTSGSMSITIQLLGTVHPDKMLLRSHAKVGDHIYVSNVIGDAGLALQYLQGKIQLSADDAKQVLPALNRPQAQIALGQALAGHAHAAIDISDGLAQDLGHILEKSHVGADIYTEKLPLSPVLTRALLRSDAEILALSAGDDYQLCFTISPDDPIIGQLAKLYSLTCIGEITQDAGLRIHQQDRLLPLPIGGWQHF